jgi:hypothetical protein
MMVNETLLSPTAVLSTSVVVGAAAAAWMLWQRSEKPESKTRKNNNNSKDETWESKIPKNFGPLQEIWPGCLYVLEADGLCEGPPTRNMTIYRPPTAANGSTTAEDRCRLVIINGIAVREETLTEILALGEPTVLIVPNCMHRDCAKVWKDRFPNLLVVTPAASVDEASKVVPVDLTTEAWAGADPFWNKVVTSREIDGWKPFETVLELDLDNNKKAFVVSDLLFTIPKPCSKECGLFSRFMYWLFDSAMDEDLVVGQIAIPKVSRVARWFAIADWKAAEQWYRTYAHEHGRNVAVICAGHGPPVVELNEKDGCTAAFVGVADQLTKPRW